jgi:hypothetical protein
MDERDYRDDPSIQNDDRPFRRVHIAQLVRDDDTGLVRVSSGVFKDKELSINIESVLASTGLSVGACLQNYKAHKLVAVTAGNGRRLGQAICRDPLPSDKSHGLVYGSKNARNIHDGLRAAAVWVIPTVAPRWEDVEAEKRRLGI